MSRISERDASEHLEDRASIEYTGRVEPPGGGGPSRGPLVLAAWVVGLGAVVGLAVMGAGTASEGTTSDTNRATASIAVAEPDAARSLRLDQPARRDEVVTTPEIIVRGQAGAGVARIRVTLESRGGKILATQWIDRTTSTRGDVLRFEARFEATMSRPAGVMWVTATALGADGIPIDAMRRRFQLSEIRAVPAVATTREVVVRGRVAKALGEVRIVLQSQTGSEIASASIDPTGHGHDGWVPFESRFQLAPDDQGKWPAFIVAVDAGGSPIEPVRHPFNVRTYLFIPASSGPAIGRTHSIHTTGEDGVMGGIPFGTNFLPEP